MVKFTYDENLFNWNSFFDSLSKEERKTLEVIPKPLSRESLLKTLEIYYKNNKPKNEHNELRLEQGWYPLGSGLLIGKNNYFPSKSLEFEINKALESPSETYIFKEKNSEYKSPNSVYDLKQKLEKIASGIHKNIELYLTTGSPNGLRLEKHESIIGDVILFYAKKFQD